MKKLKSKAFLFKTSICYQTSLCISFLIHFWSLQFLMSSRHCRALTQSILGMQSRCPSTKYLDPSVEYFENIPRYLATRVQYFGNTPGYLAASVEYFQNTPRYLAVSVQYFRIPLVPDWSRLDCVKKWSLLKFPEDTRDAVASKNTIGDGGSTAL